MGIGQVLVQLLAQIVRLHGVKRQRYRPVEERLQTRGHVSLLTLDPAGHLERVRVTHTLGRERQELVGRLLHVLIGIGVDDKFARRVGLRVGKGDETLARDGPNQVLDGRQAGASRLEPLADQALVLLGLRQVTDEGFGQRPVSGQRGRGLHLGQRLLLDRVDVGEVFVQLIVKCFGRHPLDSARSQPE